MNSLPLSVSLFALLLSTIAIAQQPAEQDPEAPSVAEKAESIAGETQEKVGDIAQRVDDSEKAREISAGILQPIYTLAEFLSFPAIHWLAFAIMTTGVVSFALQLVLAKLAVLLRFGLSMTEILSDALGLAISLVGLVLTTQAAAENSNFTQSPAAVLSATLVGAVAGFIFYRWGQSQEIEALEGRKLQAVKSSTTKSD